MPRTSSRTLTELKQLIPNQEGSDDYYWGVGIEHEFRVAQKNKKGDWRILDNLPNQHGTFLNDASFTSRHTATNDLGYDGRNTSFNVDTHQDGTVRPGYELATIGFLNEKIENAVKRVKVVEDKIRKDLRKRERVNEDSEEVDVNPFTSQLGKSDSWISSYHVTLNLPQKIGTRSNSTALAKNRADILGAWRQIAWVEPLILGLIGTPHHKAFGDGAENTEGSIRHFEGTYGNMGGIIPTDFETNPSLWSATSGGGGSRGGGHNPPYRDNQKPRLKEEINSSTYADFRIRPLFSPDGEFMNSTLGQTTQLLQDISYNEQKELIKDLKLGHGFEIRFQDSYHIEFLEDTIRFLVLVCANATDRKVNGQSTHTLTSDCTNDAIWNSAASRMFEEGYNAQLPKAYVTKLREQLSLTPYNDLPIEEQSLRLVDVMRSVEAELWEKNHTKRTAKLMLDKPMKKPLIANINGFAHIYFTKLALNKNRTQREKALDFLLVLAEGNENPENQSKYISQKAAKELMRQQMGENWSDEDFRDFIDMLEYHGLVQVNRNDNGTIDNIVLCYTSENIGEEYGAMLKDVSYYPIPKDGERPTDIEVATAREGYERMGGLEGSQGTRPRRGDFLYSVGAIVKLNELGVRCASFLMTGSEEVGVGQGRGLYFKITERRETPVTDSGFVSLLERENIDTELTNFYAIRGYPSGGYRELTSIPEGGLELVDANPTPTRGVGWSEGMPRFQKGEFVIPTNRGLSWISSHQTICQITFSPEADIREAYRVREIITDERELREARRRFKQGRTNRVMYKIELVSVSQEGGEHSASAVFPFPEHYLTHQSGVNFYSPRWRIKLNEEGVNWLNSLRVYERGNLNANEIYVIRDIDTSTVPTGNAVFYNQPNYCAIVADTPNTRYPIPLRFVVGVGNPLRPSTPDPIFSVADRVEFTDEAKEYLRLYSPSRFLEGVFKVRRSVGSGEAIESLIFGGDNNEDREAWERIFHRNPMEQVSKIDVVKVDDENNVWLYMPTYMFKSASAPTPTTSPTPQHAFPTGSYVKFNLNGMGMLRNLYLEEEGIHTYQIQAPNGWVQEGDDTIAPVGTPRYSIKSVDRAGEQREFERIPEIFLMAVPRPEPLAPEPTPPRREETPTPEPPIITLRPGEEHHTYLLGDIVKIRTHEYRVGKIVAIGGGNAQVKTVRLRSNYRYDYITVPLSDLYIATAKELRHYNKIAIVRRGVRIRANMGELNAYITPSSPITMRGFVFSVIEVMPSETIQSVGEYDVVIKFIYAGVRYSFSALQGIKYWVQPDEAVELTPDAVPTPEPETPTPTTPVEEEREVVEPRLLVGDYVKTIGHIEFPGKIIRVSDLLPHTGIYTVKLYAWHNAGEEAILYEEEQEYAGTQLEKITEEEYNRLKREVDRVIEESHPTPTTPSPRDAFIVGDIVVVNSIIHGVAERVGKIVEFQRQNVVKIKSERLRFHDPASITMLYATAEELSPANQEKLDLYNKIAKVDRGTNIVFTANEVLDPHTTIEEGEVMKVDDVGVYDNFNDTIFKLKPRGRNPQFIRINPIEHINWKPTTREPTQRRQPTAPRPPRPSRRPMTGERSPDGRIYTDDERLVWQNSQRYCLRENKGQSGWFKERKRHREARKKGLENKLKEVYNKLTK